MYARGKDQIRKASEAISAISKGRLSVRQGKMEMIENGDIALAGLYRSIHQSESATGNRYRIARRIVGSVSIIFDRGRHVRDIDHYVANLIRRSFCGSDAYASL